MVENTETISQEESQALAKAKRDLLVFWARMVGYLATGVATPIAIFSIKFGLFKEYGYVVTTDELGNVTGMNVAMNGWGIVSILIIALTAYSILKEIVGAYKGYSFVKQCLTGVLNKIVPLVIAIGIVYYLDGVVEQVLFCLTTIVLSQLAAIPLNPLPEWRYKKNGEEDYSSLATSIVKAVKELNRKEGK